jgi:hypothetical protein
LAAVPERALARTFGNFDGVLTLSSVNLTTSTGNGNAVVVTAGSGGTNLSINLDATALTNGRLLSINQYTSSGIGTLNFQDNTANTIPLTLIGTASTFANLVKVGSNTQYCWGSTAQYGNTNNTCDTGLSRTAANAIAIGNGTQGDHSAQVVLGSVKATVYTVSTLPSASTLGAGAQVTVSDATTFTPGTCTGGGSDYMLAVSNGTSWSCH